MVNLKLACLFLGTISPLTLGLPDGWSQVRRAPGNGILRLHPRHSSPRVQDLRDRLLNISTQGHESYSEFLSREEVETYLAPTQHARNAIGDWMKAHNVSEIYEHSSNHHAFTLTVRQAEALLDTDFSVYRHNTHSTEVIRTTRYAVPAHVRGYVSMIQPTTRFPSLPVQPHLEPRHIDVMADVSPEADCNTTITPACLRKLYGLEDVDDTHDEKAYSIGVAGFLEQVSQMSDSPSKSAPDHRPWLIEG